MTFKLNGKELLAILEPQVQSWMALPEENLWKLELVHPERSWNMSDFNHIMKIFQSQTKMKLKINTETLEMIVDANLIAQVQDIKNISKYGYDECLSAVSHKWLQRTLLMKEQLPEISPFHIRSSVESTLVLTLEQEPKLVDWEITPKYYSIKKEFTFEHADGIKYTLSMVRLCTEMFRRLRDSNLMIQPVQIFFSMTSSQQLEKDALIKKLLSHVLQCAMILYREPVPVTSEKRGEVVEEYYDLIKPQMDERNFRERKGEVKKDYFLAPKPVTLERFHLIDPIASYGLVSILQGYAVSEKADGERMLLYIDHEGLAYFIDNGLQVRSSGWKVSNNRLYKTLLDGEYVAYDKLHAGNERDLFAVFDIYYKDGKSVMHLPLMGRGKETRYELLKTVVDSEAWGVVPPLNTPHVNIRSKIHIMANGKDMFDACSSILKDSANLPYNIDGLIFTPVELPVFGYYPNRPVKLSRSVRWDRVLKWKPAELNTIDFLVKRVDDVVQRDGKFGALQLFTGYNAFQWEPISPIQGLRLRYDKEYNERHRAEPDYRARLFRPIPIAEYGIDTALIQIDKSGAILTSEGEMIEDEMVIEFSYDLKSDAEVGLRWKPLRVREDKTRLFRRARDISGAANDFSVAINIWRSMHAPVTIDMLAGTTIVPASEAPSLLEERVLGSEEVYYARLVPREHSYSYHMLNFHNIGIKKALYDRAKAGGQLLELACGKAGDLGRWREVGFSFVLGVDLVRNNIDAPADGAYARLTRFKRALTITTNGEERTIYPNNVFVVGDISKPIETGEAAVDEESRHILRTVYGNSRRKLPPADMYLRHIIGRAAHRFEMVSCQFAVHYMWRDEATLRGFLRNVSSNLKKGGLFISTTMDGTEVHKMIHDKDVSEGVKDGNVVWAIRKQYDTYVDGDRFGKQVDIYLEMTHKVIPEYLVHYETFIEVASTMGLRLKESELFRKTFETLSDKISEDPKKRSRLDEDILALREDAVQTKFSFINRWYVFEKI